MTKRTEWLAPTSVLRRHIPRLVNFGYFVLCRFRLISRSLEMPDDNDKMLAGPSYSSESSEMALNGEIWSGVSNDVPEMLGSNRASSTSSFSSSPRDGATHGNDPTKIESPEESTEPWIASDTHSGTSRIPFTKREKEFLCCLIQKHVYSKIEQPQNNLPSMVAFNHKKPMSQYCRVPNAAWSAIESEYNSQENVRPRSIKQLRKCWENLKHRGNIDPAALYSGKRLHAMTSMSGAFSLTTDAGEEGEANLHSAKPSEAFVETSLEDSGSTRSLEKIPSLISPCDVLPTDLSTQRRSSGGPSLIGDRAESVFQRDDMGDIIVSTSASVRKSPLFSPLSMPPPYFPSQISTFTSRTATQTPRITNVRTVRSLKPTLSQHSRRRFNVESRDRPSTSRMFSNFSMVAKSNTQKIHEMKVKLLNARIKEHEANIQKVRLQMQHAQAHHDVNMRLLRTKAAWYDAHLRRHEKQLGTGDLSMVGEEDEEEEDYHGGRIDEMEMQYDQLLE